MLKEYRRRSVEIPGVGCESNGLRAAWCHVTPEFAGYVLKNHNNRNRGLRKGVSNKYKSDQLADHWGHTHQGCAFLSNFDIADGQHRMESVRSSGITQMMLLFFELPDQELAYIDLGAKRLPEDNIKIAYDIEIDRAQKTVAGGMALGFNYDASSRSVTPQSLLAFYQKHKEAIDWTADIFRVSVKGSSSRRPVHGVIGRAWYTGELEKITEFCEVLKHGILEGLGLGPEHKQIIALRAFLNDAKNKGNGRDQFVNSYRKTEQALHNFISGTGTKYLVEATHELFLLPEEK